MAFNKNVEVFPGPQQDTQTNQENTGLKVENGRLTISEATLDEVQSFLVRNAFAIGALLGIPAARRAIRQEKPE